MRRQKQLLDKAILALSFLLLLPSLGHGLQALYGALPEDVFRFLTTSREQRRLAYLGTLTGTGYGYLKQIVTDIPDPHFFPITRYATYTKNAHLFFPFERNKIDSRLMVGIDLETKDLLEAPIVKAKDISNISPPFPGQTFWAFNTATDYDSLTGFQIHFTYGTAQIVDEITIALLTNFEKAAKPEFTWQWQSVPIEKEIFLELPEQLNSFSFDRGHKPFGLVVRIKSSIPVRPSQIIVQGIKINLKNYTLINKDQGCFTAIDTHFLEEIMRTNNQQWLHYLESIRNV